MKPKALPIVLSAPSGAGKSTIAKDVLKANPNLMPSISCTTRSPRGAERNGRDYFFLSEGEFKRRVKRGDFLEWAEVHGHLYGTLKATVEGGLEEGRDVLMVIDVQGAKAVKKSYPEGVYIFVKPPSWDVLVKRLKKRGSDSQESIRLRLANARKEFSYLPLFDYVVVNNRLKTAVAEVLAILRAEHRRRK
ncbi:MAG: guanylate kinase [Elusimicrobia bacterium]|nr:guanylate kinase [Candidatus Obscuribacterium magneticum]